jgi:hypothetical protein
MPRFMHGPCARPAGVSPPASRSSGKSRAPARSGPGEASCLRSRLLITVVLVAMAALSTPTLAAAAPPETTTWHRLNPDRSHPPEHELWQCRTTAVWVCHYEKAPEPALGFHWDDAAATFVGHDITGAWQCPDFFGTRCAAVTQVVEGTSHLHASGQPAQRYLLEFVFLDDSVLYIVVNVPTEDGIFTFACPWYPTFTGALAANPFPLPFNGVDWPADDCLA